MQPHRDHPRANVLGVGVSVLTMEQALHSIHSWIDRRDAKYICTLDVHALIESRKHDDIAAIYREADMVAADGMPLVWLLKRKGYPAAERVCGPDLMPAVFERSKVHGYRHFLYGSTEATLDALRTRLHERYPGANVVGSYSPPFRTLTPEEQHRVDVHVNRASPDIVWVGLGAPKQDRWMAARRSSLRAPVLIGVGGAFDMLAGTVKRAPPILRQTGCEWMYRVSQEPKRLARRYVESNARFVFLLLGEQLGRSAARHQRRTQ